VLKELITLQCYYSFNSDVGIIITRCLPLNFNATAIPASSNHAHGAVDRKQIVSTLADVDPMSLDRSIRFCHVGGLESHIRCLKEMVVFPMLYREVFEKFHIQPPKGVLFHGPPGMLSPSSDLGRESNYCIFLNTQLTFLLP
jgi:hypothetical protein